MRAEDPTLGAVYQVDKVPEEPVLNGGANHPEYIGTCLLARRLAGKGWSTKLQGCSYAAPALLPRTRPGAPSQFTEFW